jgi:hypothetical protein
MNLGEQQNILKVSSNETTVAVLSSDKKVFVYNVTE